MLYNKLKLFLCDNLTFIKITLYKFHKKKFTFLDFQMPIKVFC